MLRNPFPIFSRGRALIEVCRSCSRRCGTAGLGEDGELERELRLRVRAAGRHRDVDVVAVPCLYRCPLREVSVRVGRTEANPMSGETRLHTPGDDVDALFAWACETLDDG